MLIWLLKSIIIIINFIIIISFLFFYKSDIDNFARKDVKKILVGSKADFKSESNISLNEI